MPFYYIGTGKSTLANTLSSELRWPVADKDDAKNVLANPIFRIDPNLANELSYDIMFRNVDRHLRNGFSVIVDCPLTRLTLYECAVKIAAKHGCKVVVIECFCSDETHWYARLENRGLGIKDTEEAHKPKSEADIRQYLSKCNDLEGWSESLNNYSTILRIDTSRTSNQNSVSMIKKFLVDINALEELEIPFDDPIFLNA